MDDIVKQAMAKWPDVPNVYGWLSLDRRGVWRIKGDAVTNTDGHHDEGRQEEGPLLETAH